MLDMGFEPQIRALLNEIPTAPTRQTVFFTATWPKEVQLLALEFLTSPVLISAGNDSYTMLFVRNRPLDRLVF